MIVLEYVIIITLFQGDTSEIVLANAWCSDSHQKIKQLLADLADQELNKLDDEILKVGLLTLDNGGYMAKSPIGC